MTIPSDEALENAYGIHIIRLPDPVDPSFHVDVVEIKEVRELAVTRGVTEKEFGYLIAECQKNYDGWATRLRPEAHLNVTTLEMMVKIATQMEIIERMRHSRFEVPRWMAEEQAMESARERGTTTSSG